MVIAYHLREGALYLSPRLTPSLFMDRGHLWVDLFFILSGFIITYTASADGAPLSWTDTKRFWSARITRIFPLHLFCTALFLLLTLATAALALKAGKPLGPYWSFDGLASLVQEALLIHSIGLPGFLPLNAVSWSISAEMFAYALLPVMLIVGRRKGGMPLMLALSLLFYAWILWRDGKPDDLHLSYGLSPLRCLAAFMIGQAICLHRDFWERLPDAMLALLQLAALASAFAVMALPVSDVFVIPPFALLVAATWPDRGWLCVLLKLRPLQYLGDISYSIYLMHWWSLMAVNMLFPYTIARLHLPYALEQGAWMIAVPLCAISAAAFTYHFIELPTRRHFKRRRETAVAAVGVP